ncbi:hypothetical protein F7734_04725 [Scytonema sp. UIC 10036]|uniref:Tn3 family transposase post-transcriptional regulator TnpC n=1 Tax=Scytonema sp. UIC 10036 TaxID=2304196 RepID=UPI0012DA6CDF|nr:Tn3 family transposase post-transcriptional regulator TnpC [Scytonema sp. UIC 10036]MUG91812.1 hypothetical protein [Scytonema sp. UIC 10036]
MSKKTQETVYGIVSSKKLDELQQNFDTTQILAAVDAIDEIRSRICEPDGIRLELLHLHSMAHTIINGDFTMNAPIGTCIWEVAQELELEIDDFASKLDAIATLLGKLGELAPDDEYEDEDEDDFDFDE